MFYVIQFEINQKNNTSLYITKYRDEISAIQHLMKLFFNSCIIEEGKYIFYNKDIELQKKELQKFWDFDYDVIQYIDKYMKEFSDKELKIFQKINKYRKLYYTEWDKHYYNYIVYAINEKCINLYNYNFNELKNEFEI